MRKLVGVICALVIASTAQAAEVKIGIVDLGEIVKKSNAGKAAVASLEKKSAKYKETFKSREKELEKMKPSPQEIAKMSPAQRSEKEKQFVKKITDYQKSVQDAQKDLVNRESELTEKIIADVEKVASDYGKKNGYDLVVKKNGLIMAEEKYQQKDITAEVLKLINEKK